MFEKNTKIALLQIATFDGAAYVIDVRKIHQETNFTKIGNLFNDTTIAKMGSGCKYDATLMNQVFDYNVQNVFEIKDLASVVLSQKEYEALLGAKSGLKWMCRNLMGLNFRDLDWWEYEQFAQAVIPSKLINYAALDVVTVIDLYLNLFCYHHKIDLVKSSEEADALSSQFGSFNVQNFRLPREKVFCLTSNFKY